MARESASASQRSASRSRGLAAAKSGQGLAWASATQGAAVQASGEAPLSTSSGSIGQKAGSRAASVSGQTGRPDARTSSAFRLPGR